MTMSSFLARLIPLAAMPIALVAFGTTGGVVALMAIVVLLVVWAMPQLPATTVEYDFAD
jgi:hypothetical protein